MNCQFSPLALVAILAVLAGGCGGREEQPPSSSQTPTATTSAQADSERIQAENEWLKEELERIRGEKNALEQEVDSLKAQVAQGSATTPSAPRLGSAAGLPGEPMPGDISVPKAPPGPLVFEHSLATSDALEGFFRSYGAYGGEAVVEAGSGVKLGGGWTQSVVWANPFLGEEYRVEFDVLLRDNASSAWILSGPGGGNSLDTGYCCRFDRANMTIFRSDEEKQRLQLPEPTVSDTWTHVAADVSGGEVTIRLNGSDIAHLSDPTPLVGPIHGWVGFAGGEARYRNLRIWSASRNTQQDRQLTPPATEKPRPNGRLLYELSLTDKDLGSEWWKSQPNAVSIDQGELVLSECIRTKPWRRNAVCNSRPVIVLNRALPFDLACEVEFEYPAYEAMGFIVMLCSARDAPASPNEREAGWIITIPAGNGKTTVQWHGGPDDAEGDTWHTRGEILAQTPYYAPVSEKKYSVRIEAVADTLRLFLNEGLLLATTRPAGAGFDGKPVFLGLAQYHSGSRVHALRVFELPPERHTSF